MATQYETANIIVEQQGEVIVNDGIVYRKYDDIVALEIDLHSKHAEISATGGSPDGETIILEANENTMHINKMEGEIWEKYTILKFPDYRGWTLFASELSRYTLYVVFTRNTEPEG